MSAPLAGKFQDHYAVLGVDPKSDSDSIQAAYAKAAQKYHPNNPDTGDQAKFDAVNLAFEVLSDAQLRREFDKIKGVDQDDGVPKFSGHVFFEALGHETTLRVALMCILYDRRRTKPFTPSLSMRQVENTLHAKEEELNFALWYLKQRGLVGQDDKSSLLITVEGMDFLETNRPAAAEIMPFIKAGAIAAAKPAEPKVADHKIAVPLEVAPPEPAHTEPPETELQPKRPESVMNVMRRARAKG
jgi:hypothetical protein